jgi:hypothetical protein
MSSLSEAFDAPVILKDYGLDLSLPKLDLDDHAKWCEEINAARRPAKEKRIPGNTPPADRARLLARIEFESAGLDDVSELLYTPAGVRTVLDKSLEKSGRADAAERKAIINKIPPWRAQSLAFKLSGLFETRAPAPAAENPAPNPQSGESGSEATSTPATGDTSASSSAST